MKKLLFLVAIISSFSSFAQDNEWLAALSSNVEPEYNFTMSANMAMTSYKNGTPSKPMQMTVYINNDKGLFATSMADDKGKNPMLMIVDQDKGNMVMVDERNKTAMAMNMQAFMNIEKVKDIKAQSSAGDVECKKTGTTKTIGGYICEGYVCTNAERNGRYEIFVNNKVKFDLGKGNENNPFAEYFSKAGDLDGMMMEGKFYENDELQATLSVSNINEKENYTINTSGYKKGLR